MTQKNTVKSLEKALILLETLAEVEELGLTAEELGNRTELNSVTAWRLLATLKARGFVKYNSSTRKYSLGPTFLLVAQSAYARFDLVDAVRPILQEAVQCTGETANFAIMLTDNEISFAQQHLSPLMVHAAPKLGVRLPMHCTAAGKAILAYLPEAEVEKFYREEGLAARTSKSITSLTVLLQELAHIRIQGYAVDDGEMESGGRCIGVPILNSKGRPIAAISITGPVDRVTEARFDEIGAVLLDAVRKIPDACKDQ